MSFNYLANVPKLSGRDNYQDWSFAIENIFVLEGLSGCLSGAEKDAANIAKGKAKLILTIDPKLYMHVKDCGSAKSAWDTLKKLYEDKGVTRKIGLLRSLISMRQENYDSMELYVNQVVETSQKLKRTGFKIDDEWVGSLLLAGLPEKFTPMVLAIEHSGIGVTTDVIKSKLLDMQPDDSRTTNGAFVVKPRKFKCKQKIDNNHHKHQQSGNSYDVSKKRKEIVCYNCRKPGHYMSKCPMKMEKDHDKALSTVYFTSQFGKNEFYIDSGCSMHMTSRKDWLNDFEEEDCIRDIMVANEEKLPVKGKGNLKISTIVNNDFVNIEIKNIRYVPGLTTNLLSVSQMIRNGNKVIFNQSGCTIFDSCNEPIASAALVNNVYKLLYRQTEALAMASAEVWHRRLAHVNYRDLIKMKDSVNGLDFKDVCNKENFCQVCCEGKQSRLPFKHVGTRATSLLELVHSDVCGPMETLSLGGSRYFVLFEDDYSKMVFVYILKTKDQVFESFKNFKTLVEKQKGVSIKCLRSDGGGEFCSKEFENFLTKNGIIHQKTNSYTPQQNGISERMNRTIMEKTRCLMFDANFDNRFWAEAVNTAAYLRNRTGTSGLSGKTPFEVWHGRKPDISNLRIFGSEVMTHIPKERRLKLDRKSKKMFIVGYGDTVKGYRVFNPETGKITTSRDVIIRENVRNSDFQELYITEEEIESVDDSVGEDKEKLSETRKIAETIEGSDSEWEPDHSENADNSEDQLDNIPEIVTEEVRRSNRAPKPITFDDFVSYLCCDSKTDPLDVEDMMSRPDRDMWISAMEEELKSFKENKAWEIVEIPESGTIVKSKWVFRRKSDSEGKIKYRARLVAKGFMQKAGIDYGEIFSPVVRFSTIRLLFALAAKYNLDIYHLDVTTAFLNGELDRDVFMEIPQGLQISNCQRKVLKLKKAIYGLKQGSRSWNDKIDSFLLQLGYKKSMYEPCVYLKTERNQKTVVCLYVDDFFIFSNNKQQTDFLKRRLGETFKIKDLGEVRNCLGMQVTVDKRLGVINLNQGHYVDQLLERFKMTDCKIANTPMEMSLDLNKKSNGSSDSEQIPYQQLIGSLMYLSVLTRPDISFAVSYMSQFNNCFTETHFKHAKRILRYLKGTKNYGLTFKGNESYLECFVDADWGNSSLDRRSYTGYCFQFSGSSISWESKKQNTVALSSTEAEYMAISEASKEAIYLKSLLQELMGVNGCVTLYNDNMGAQKLAVNPVFHKRTKHIDVRHHFIRNAIHEKHVNLKYLETRKMPADMLTKGLGLVKHSAFVKQLGIVEIE